jgi:hypothetical protein
MTPTTQTVAAPNARQSCDSLLIFIFLPNDERMHLYQRGRTSLTV